MWQWWACVPREEMNTTKHGIPWNRCSENVASPRTFHTHNSQTAVKIRTGGRVKPPQTQKSTLFLMICCQKTHNRHGIPKRLSHKNVHTPPSKSPHVGGVCVYMYICISQLPTQHDLYTHPFFSDKPTQICTAPFE